MILTYILTTIGQLNRLLAYFWLKLVFSSFETESPPLRNMDVVTDYGRPVRKSPSLHDRKSNPNPKFIGTAEAYFVCHIGPKFQISLIYAFIGCP